MNKIPLSARILVSMFIGIAIGVYRGEMFFAVNDIANGFVMLLQMTALPYIALSLIVGIGGLSPLKANTTFKHSALVILLLLMVSLIFILLAPLAFPDWQNASFYSANTIKTIAENNLVTLFIPANPFSAFANGIIPAIVLFSVFLGVGLMTVKGKKHTLLLFSNLQKAVSNISHLVMRFAPLGVFCLGVRAGVTIEAEQLNGLFVYIITAISLVALICLLVLPACIAVLTPYSYKDILVATREAMITAFATGSFFIVIPIIVEKIKALIAEHANDDKDISQVPTIIVPISFSLPIGGKLLALLFALFAAWFSGAHLSISDYSKLITVGIPQLFGPPSIAMPTLLELMNVPAAFFDFFIIAENLIVGRLGALMSVMFAAVLALLIATTLLKKHTFKWRLFGQYLATISLISFAVFISLRFSFDTMGHQYQGYASFINRDFLLKQVKTTYIEEADKSSLINHSSNLDVLTKIKQRGFIRIGYFRDDLPYSFHNKDGKLVGFDIEIFNQLALDLGVNIEFVKIFHDQAAKLLNSGYLDLTTGIPLIPDNMKEFTLTIPYSSQTIAFLVKKERRNEFTRWQNILQRNDLTVGIPESFFYENAVHKYFTRGKAWKISTPRLFFKEKYQHIDAMLFGAPAASAWSLLYPEYTVVTPKPARKPLFMAFPIHKNDQAFELFMRNWIEMKKQNQLLDKLFDYWIEGHQSKEKSPKV